MQSETHVVTVGLQFADNQQPPGFTCEIYRGAQHECLDILMRMPGVSHDLRPVAAAFITIGTVEEWETWLSV